MKVLPEYVAALCRRASLDVLTPKEWNGTPLDKTRLLWGLAGVESSFGMNCTPRHENGYCRGGRHYDQERSQKWGCLAHCSFGPWQVMFSNFPLGVSPLSLVWDDDGRIAAEICLRYAVVVVNAAIARGAKHLGDIVIAYNGPEYEAQYSAELEACMEKPMPQDSSVVTS